MDVLGDVVAASVLASVVFMAIVALTGLFAALWRGDY